MALVGERRRGRCEVITSITSSVSSAYRVDFTW